MKTSKYLRLDGLIVDAIANGKNARYELEVYDEAKRHANPSESVVYLYRVRGLIGSRLQALRRRDAIFYSFGKWRVLDALPMED